MVWMDVPDDAPALARLSSPSNRTTAVVSPIVEEDNTTIDSKSAPIEPEESLWCVDSYSSVAERMRIVLMPRDFKCSVGWD